jgi:transposase InsO family protein
VIVDIYSRMVTGWMVSPRECGELAERLITEACWNHCIEAESELIIHSDRGSPMKSKVVAQMMADLGVTKSLGRPQVCNDNPYSNQTSKPSSITRPFQNNSAAYKTRRNSVQVSSIGTTMITITAALR